MANIGSRVEIKNFVFIREKNSIFVMNIIGTKQWRLSEDTAMGEGLDIIMDQYLNGKGKDDKRIAEEYLGHYANTISLMLEAVMDADFIKGCYELIVSTAKRRLSHIDFDKTDDENMKAVKRRLELFKAIEDTLSDSKKE